MALVTVRLLHGSYAFTSLDSLPSLIHPLKRDRLKAPHTPTESAVPVRLSLRERHALLKIGLLTHVQPRLDRLRFKAQDFPRASSLRCRQYDLAQLQDDIHSSLLLVKGTCSANHRHHISCIVDPSCSLALLIQLVLLNTTFHCRYEAGRMP